MLFSYGELLERFGSAYQIKKAVNAGRLFRLSRGLYSDDVYQNPDAIACAQWAQAVITMDSAFYRYDLTDAVPIVVHVATPRNATRIKDARVRQYFMEPRLMEMGVRTVECEDGLIRIFSRERMLVELLRNSARLSFDYYKELISSFRRISDELDMREVEDCIALYSRTDSLLEKMQREVL